MMKKKLIWIGLAALCVVAGCKEKKQTEDIIAPRKEAVKPSGPVRMQSYNNATNVRWLDKYYQVEVNRQPNDSLPLVKDETGQMFVDNEITVTVKREDGSTAIKKRFTKASFVAYVGSTFKKHGILEGLVFDETDGNRLKFAASVCLPQTDEYIPLEVKIDRMGQVNIERDTELDTSGNGNHDEDDDGV